MNHAAPTDAALPSRGQPSSALMSGALAGLLGLTFAATGCDDGPRPPAGQPPATEVPGDPAAPDSSTQYDIVVSTTLVTYEAFVTACEERGGFVQTTAACAGNNACRGFSYIEPTLTEHSCKGLNQCGPGMSCVVLSADSGLSGQEIYEQDGSCAATCHAQFEPVYDPSIYTLYMRTGDISPREAVDRFKNGSDKRLFSTVAFGVDGINDDGTAFAHMPPHYLKYSRAEIERVVAYIRTLPIQVYEVTGATGSAAGH